MESKPVVNNNTKVKNDNIKLLAALLIYVRKSAQTIKCTKVNMVTELAKSRREWNACGTMTIIYLPECNAAGYETESQVCDVTRTVPGQGFPTPPKLVLESCLL